MMSLPFINQILTTSSISVVAWLFTAHPLTPFVGLAAGILLTSVVLDRMASEVSNAEQINTKGVADVPGKRRALVVGSGAVGRQLAENLEAAGGHVVVGFADDPSDVDSDTRWQVLGSRDATAALIQEYAIDEVFLAYAPTWQQRLSEEIAAYCPHVDVKIVPSPYEALIRTSSVENYGDIALVRLNPDPRLFSDTLKRIFDLSASIFGLVVLSPFSLIIALLIKATSKGPVIFAQERIGRFGKPFLVYKFRTMRSDAEVGTGPVLSTGLSDSRMTSIGKWLRLFRIDEIPQLWNVVRGEMSMVGPRPERPYFVRQFTCMVPSYARRHQVRPGITGMAQVCGGYHTDARDKLRFDLIYVSHRSLWLDLTILVRTILVVVLPNRK